MIAVFGVPLNVDTIILSCIFSKLLSDFRVRELRSVPTPPLTALTEFFHADAETNIHPLPVLWYSISTSLWWYLCSCTYTMSVMLYHRCQLQFLANSNIKCHYLYCALHLSNFCLSSVANFFNTGARVPTSTECVLFLPVWWVMQFGQMVWVWVMVIFWWLYFKLINRCHS